MSRLYRHSHRTFANAARHLDARHSVATHLRDQFRHPRGQLGRVASRIMASRPSNVERSSWTVDLLEPEADHRILEIGFGPGLAIERLAKVVTDGEVIGVDHSETMVAAAACRNAEAIASGRVRLELGSADALPSHLCELDRIFAVNVWGFWEERQGEIIADLARRLRSGGMLALTVQPRHPGATADSTATASSRLIEQFTSAGLTGVRGDLLSLEPVPAVCVRGSRP